MSDENIGTAEVVWEEGKGARVVRADDVIEVTGELAEQFGVKPPLDGRIDLGGGYVYALGAWTGTGMPGRHAGTYLGFRVARGE